MKKTSLLLIASLAVLTSGASAASNSQNDSEVVILPTYVVTAPRYLPVEQQINASLKEFVQQASAPVAIAPELSVLKARAAAESPLAKIGRVPVSVRIAKS